MKRMGRGVVAIHRRKGVVKLLVAGVVASGMAFAPARAAAQSLAEAEAGIVVTDRPLLEALRILQRAGASLVYSPDLLPAGHRVSCDCADATVGEVLDMILRDTGLTYRVGRSQIRIVPELDEAPERVLTGVIAGRLTDMDGGSPVVNGMVRIDSGQGILSNASGWFLIRGVPEGVHTVTVTGIGWEDSVQPGVEVSAADTTNLLIRMKRAAVPLPEILVAPGTYGMLEAVPPGSVRALTRTEIQTMPQFGEDVFRSMKRLPGVAAGDISTKLSIRGGADREVLVRLDGLELFEPYHMRDWDGALGIVDLNALGGVQLTAGGFGAEHGDKMTGVFDMTSRTSVGPARSTLGLSISNVTAMSRGGFDDERGVWLFSARRGFMDLVMKLIGQDERLSPEYYDVFGKVAYQVNPRHLVSAHVLHAGDDFRLKDVGTAADDVEEIDIGTNWSSSYGWLRWKALFGSRVSSETMAWMGRVGQNREGFVLDTGRPSMPDLISAKDDREFTFRGVRNDLAVELNDRALLKAGAEVKWMGADYVYTNRSEQRELLPQEHVGLVPDSVVVQASPDGYELNGYVAGRVRPTDALTLEAGVRYDRISHTDENSIAPRFLAAFDVGPGTKLRASMGRYYQSHGIHELSVGDGESEFFPSERADQVAVGLEQELPAGLRLRVELYDREIRDQRPQYLNLKQELMIFPEAEGDRIRVDPERGRARGLEALLERRSGRHWAWSASYALAVAEDEIDGAWVPRRYDQRHTVGLNAAYQPTSQWNFSLGWRFHTGWPSTEWSFEAQRLEDGSVFWTRTFGPLRADRLPSYHRLDFRVTREMMIGGNTLYGYLDLFNVYDRTNIGSYEYSGTFEDGFVRMTRMIGEEMLPLIPTIGFRYEF